MSLRLLVLDAYDEPGRRAVIDIGATPGGELYRRLLLHLRPDARVELALFGAAGFALPAGAALSDYDGLVFTGSNMTIHQDTAAVREQIALVQRALDAGLDCFGSCWAAQLAVTADGGRCERNPRGREFGVSRGIALNERGRAHPLFEGRPPVFDALTSHEDHIVQLGAHTEGLAGNEFSPVQAVSIQRGRGVFWAVQYHPEFNLWDLAQLARLRGAQLIAQGFFKGDPPERALADYIADLEDLENDPGREDLARRLGIPTKNLLDVDDRATEVENWLRHRLEERAPVTPA